MYQYDNYDQTLVNERVAQFRGQVRRYLDGKLSDEEFRQLRLRNGLYYQLHAYMFRIAVPYGLLSSRQMRTLAHCARTYDRGYGHFTTRQNIQFNWPELEDVPKIMEELAAVQMHAIQTSGNVVRNVTADQYAGVAADELEDPRPYCEILRQWSTLHPEFCWLPRKFKIGVTGAAEDRAAIRLHDIGLELVRGEDGEVGFRVFVGGGMGRTPIVGKVVREFLEKRHLLTYVEAVLRVYNQLGRRDDNNKARIKILVRSLGVKRFRKLVEEEWELSRDDGLELTAAEIKRMQGFFAPPDYQSPGNGAAEVEQQIAADPSFARWVKRNTLSHKVSGYRIAVISAKAPGAPPGDLTDGQMDGVADLADQFSFGQLRSTHEQNLVLADVAEGSLHALWEGLKALELATPNIGTLNDMICCPGLDFCSLAKASTIPVAARINEKFSDLDYLYDLGELKLKMSGCMNGCGHHSVGHLGLLGVDKKGSEWYQVILGGSAANDAALGTRIGPAIALDDVADVIEKILILYVDVREEGERFVDTVRRTGIAPFKERVYADHPKSKG